MILVDSNVFIINEIFTNDSNYPESHRLIERLPIIESCVSVYNYFEICAVLSFNVSTEKLNHLLHDFRTYFGVDILFPQNLELSTRLFFKNMHHEMTRLLPSKMDFVDALILSIAEEYKVSNLITWNLKHFHNKTHIPVLSPSDFLDIDE